MNGKSSSRYLLPVAFVAAQFLPGALPTADAAKLVYENTFTSGWGDLRTAGKPFQSSCDESVMYRLADPLNGSNPAARFFQRGDLGCASDGKHRTQKYLESADGKLFNFRPHVDYFVGYRVFVPSNFPASWYSANKSFHFLWAMAGSKPGETLTGLTGINSQAALRINRRYLDDAGKYTIAGEWNVPLNMGAWNTVVVHLKREWTNTGTLKAWVNGKQVVNQSNVRTASNPDTDPANPTSKIGIYWGFEDRPDDVTVYLDDFRIAEGADGYSLVDPLGSTAPSAPTGLQLQVSSGS
jgi:hypothetical protein